MDTLKIDFDRFCDFHSWYKHSSLEGKWFSVSLQKGQQHRYNFIPIDDEVGMHWHFCYLPNSEVELEKYKVKLNYCMMSGWRIYEDLDITKSNYNHRGWYVFRRDRDKINEFMKLKYPHLEPLNTENSKGVKEFMSEEYNEMLQNITTVAKQYLDDIKN
jgi:hypothetical protein